MSQISEDFILTSKSPWSPIVPRGSIYLEVEKRFKTSNFNFPWMISNKTGEKTYLGQVLTLSKRFANVLSKYGVVQKSVVHMMLGSQDVRIFAAAFGTWILGGVLSFGDHEHDPKTTALQIEDADVRAVLTTAMHFDKVKQALEHLDKKHKRPVILCLGKGSDELGINILEDLNEASEQVNPVEVNVKEEIASILYTSGTTGRPKGVLHTHFSALNFLSDSFELFHESSETILNIRVSIQAGFFAMLSFHVFGRVTVINDFDVDSRDLEITKCISRPKVQSVNLTGGELIQFVESEEIKNLDKKDARKVKFVIPIAATVPNSINEKILEYFPNAKIYNVYGTSETGMILTTDKALNKRLGTVNGGVQVKVVDINSGENLGPNCPGEVCAKSEMLMKGYLNRPDETDKYFDDKGFGHMGDLVYYDDFGNVFFVERIKEMLKFQNRAISPSEIESILYQLEAVRDCIVWGQTDHKLNDVISACIVLKEGYEQSQKLVDEIREFANSRLPDIKMIRGSITFRDNIKRNKLGKIQRLEMKRMLEENLS